MVKWLEEITVTDGESGNFYHFHDNRVLPSHVTEQLAKAEGERQTPQCLLLQYVTVSYDESCLGTGMGCELMGGRIAFEKYPVLIRGLLDSATCRSFMRDSATACKALMTLKI